MLVWRCVTFIRTQRWQMWKPETCKRTSGGWAARSGAADRCVDGKRPFCPVKEPSTCSAAAAAAPAAGWKDGWMRTVQPPLTAETSERRKRAGPHLLKRSFTSEPFRCLGGWRKKIRGTAVFTHFTKPGNYLRYSGGSSSISWDYVVRRPPPSPHFNHWSKRDLCSIRYFTAPNYSYYHAEPTQNDWWLSSELLPGSSCIRHVSFIADIVCVNWTPVSWHISLNTETKLSNFSACSLHLETNRTETGIRVHEAVLLRSICVPSKSTLRIYIFNLQWKDI